MARGTPDGQIADQQFAAQVTDLGQVAATLWGFSPIDSQGRVIYLETFNNGINGWTLNTTGAASVPVLETPTTYAFSPPNVCTLDAGISVGDRSWIARELYMGTTRRIGIEIGFQFSAGCQPRIQIDYKPRGTGLSAWLATIRFEQTFGSWRYVLPGPTWTDFYIPGSPPGSQNMLAQIKVVADWATGKLVRAYIGDQLFDLSTVAMFPSASSYTGLLIASVYDESKGAGHTGYQLGYVLITKDEP